MRTIIGIDPGLDGAIFAYYANGACEVVDTPTWSARRNRKTKRHVDAKRLYSIIRTVVSGISIVAPTTPRETVVWVEKVNAMPGQGVTSSFSLGRSFGMLEGVLASMGDADVEFIASNKWKKALGVSNDKQSSLDLARELFPTCFEAGFFDLQKHDGRAEAALIAHYGRQQEANNGIT